MKNKDQILLEKAYQKVLKEDMHMNDKDFEDKEFDTFLNKNLSNALTPIKELNTTEAINFLNQRVSELLKKKVVFGPDNNPFYVDNQNGNAMAHVTTLDDPRQNFKIRIDPDLDNSQKKLTRIVNIAVNEFLRGDKI